MRPALRWLPGRLRQRSALKPAHHKFNPQNRTANMSTNSGTDHIQGRWKLSRLEGFSDGVIAIAITILVLGLEVPSVHDVNDKELPEFLQDSIRPAIGYVTSFLLVGMFWMGHYSIFHHLIHATPMLAALNGLFLLCVSFLPFPTGLHSAYPDNELAMVLYGIALLLCGLSLLGIWLYALWGHRLVDRKTPPVFLRSMTGRLMIGPVLSLAGIGAAFISIPLSKVVYLAIPAVYMLYLLVFDGVRSIRNLEESKK